MAFLTELKNERQKIAASQFADKMAAVQALLDVNMIELKGSEFTLHDYLLKDKDHVFIYNQIESLSMYFIVKNEGAELPFTVVRRSDRKPIATWSKETGTDLV